MGLYDFISFWWIKGAETLHTQSFVIEWKVDFCYHNFFLLITYEQVIYNEMTSMNGFQL